MPSSVSSLADLLSSI